MYNAPSKENARPRTYITISQGSSSECLGLSLSSGSRTVTSVSVRVSVVSVLRTGLRVSEEEQYPNEDPEDVLVSADSDPVR